MSEYRKFCANPECELHGVEHDQEGLTTLFFGDQMWRSGRIVRRHLYQFDDGRQLHLCTVCHGAVQLVRGERR